MAECTFKVVKIMIIHMAAVLRIRIRMDPFHLAGSGSVSDDPDPGPGVKFLKNCSFSSKILTIAKMKMLNFF